nr:hypothetical protein [Tanacetum cinerariifolium]
MHNNIMAAGSKDRPPMLATGRYPQWRSRFLRYIDTRPNGDALRKCILNGPYIPTTVVVQAVAAIDDYPAVPEHTTVETPMNMSPENKAHFESEKEAIHLILTGIVNKIYSTIDACQTAQEMWEAIKMLQQGKEIAKPITPPSESASKEDNDPKQAQRDKDMQKNLALIAKYFKRIYKPTNNNLRTFSNSRNKNVDTTLRENVGSPIVQQSGIQCFNCKEFGHFAKECRKPKRVKDSAYHKEKMLLCKQAEKGELEAHYSYMAKIQEVPTTESGTDSEPLEQVQNDTRYNVFTNDLQHSEQSESICNTCIVEMNDSNVVPDSPDMFDDDIQNDKNDVECDDERVALANLKLEVDENKKIQKQLKKANTTLAQELKECKTILAETSKTLGESNSVRDSRLVALQNKYNEFEKYNAFNDRTVDYDQLERQLNETLGKLAQKDIEIKEGKSVETKFDKASVVRQPNAQRIPKPSVLGKPAPFSDSLERQYFSKTKSVLKTNVLEGLSKTVTAQTLPQTARQAVSNTNVLKPCMYRIDTRTTQTRAPQSPQTFRNTNSRVSKSKGVNHKTNVSRLQLRSNQMKDKVVPSNSQVKLKKTQVKDHPRIPSISNKNKFVTACNDSLNSRTSNVNAVCATCGKCLVDSDHFAWVTKMLNDVNARTKKPNIIIQIILFIVDSGCTKHMTSNLKLLYNFVKKYMGTVHFGNDQFAPILGYGDLVQGNITINRVYYVEVLNHNLFSVGQFCDADLEVAFRKSTCFVRDLYGNDLLTDAHVPSQHELDLLFGPFYDEFFTACTSSVNKSSSPTNNSNQQDTQPTTNIQPTSEPSTPTYVHAEENNVNQVEEEHLQDDEFTIPFCTPVQEVAESSSYNIDLEMCMFALTVSTTEPKNIKEAMADSAWIEAMQEELHQFDRIQAKYTLEILHKHGMEKGQSIGTSMAMKPKLDAELSGNPVDQTDYRSKIGSLMYLTYSRPDIVQAICYCARYQSRPTKKHLKEVKRIFRYLRGTINMGLWYPKGSSFGLTSFLDADHAGCIDTRKSTFGGIQFLGDKLVSLMSKKQNCTAMSLAEAEYVATEYQLADMFTKALHEDRFKYLVRRIGMRCLTPAELEVLEKESA